MSGWGVAAAVVSAASTIIGGSLSSSAARAEAARAEAYANYSSDAIRAWGREQSSMITMAAKYNISQYADQLAFNTELNNMVTEHNINSLRAINDYNSLLYDEEINQILDALELDKELLHIDYAKAIGTTIANQSVSGTIIGQDSNADVVVSMKAEEALNDLVITTNAQNKVKSIQNAAAQGTWQTEVEAANMRFEGQLQNVSMAYETMANSKALAIDSVTQGTTALRSSENRALEISMGGYQTSDAQRAQAASYMFRGLTSAGSSLLAAVDKYKD